MARAGQPKTFTYDADEARILRDIARLDSRLSQTDLLAFKEKDDFPVTPKEGLKAATMPSSSKSGKAKKRQVTLNFDAEVCSEKRFSVSQSQQTLTRNNSEYSSPSVASSGESRGTSSPSPKMTSNEDFLKGVQGKALRMAAEFSNFNLREDSSMVSEDWDGRQSPTEPWVHSPGKASKVNRRLLRATTADVGYQRWKRILEADEKKEEAKEAAIEFLGGRKKDDHEDAEAVNLGSFGVKTGRSILKDQVHDDHPEPSTCIEGELAVAVSQMRLPCHHMSIDPKACLNQGLRADFSKLTRRVLAGGLKAGESTATRS